MKYLIIKIAPNYKMCKNKCLISCKIIQIMKFLKIILQKIEFCDTILANVL